VLKPSTIIALINFREFFLKVLTFLRKFNSLKKIFMFIVIIHKIELS